MMRLRVVSLLLTLGGCSFGFDSPSLVKDLRVLAIEVDPPELTPDTWLSPLRARALVVGSGAGEALDWSVALCLVAPTGAMLGGGHDSPVARCPQGSAVLAGGTTSVDGIEYAGPVPAEVVALAGSSQSVPPQLQLELTVGAAPLYAEKSVRLSPVLPPGQESNQNPVLSGLTFDGQPWLAGVPISIESAACSSDKLETITNADGTTSTLCTHEVVPSYDNAQRQYFVGLSGITGEYVMEQEALRFSWFADQGVFHDDTTQQTSDGLTQQIGVSNVWRESSALKGDVTFWIVVRDGRGGASWETRVLHFEG